jgi:1-deoxy-D-xylulose-5-phosphate reductoisomerase
VLAQLGSPDMRTPIAHTLAWPDRMETPVAPLDLARIGRLDFADPDPERFPALRLAREAVRVGGARPAVLNAANEMAVDAFLDRRIAFLDIAAIVEETMHRYDPAAPGTIEDVIAIDREARSQAAEAMKVLVY